MFAATLQGLRLLILIQEERNEKLQITNRMNCRCIAGLRLHVEGLVSVESLCAGHSNIKLSFVLDYFCS